MLTQIREKKKNRPSFNIKNENKDIKIKLNLLPTIPVGMDPKTWEDVPWGVKQHKKMEYFILNNIKITPIKTSGGAILASELKNKDLVNINTLEYFYNNPELIPEEWRGKRVFALGTIYIAPDGHQVVRCLSYYRGEPRIGPESLEGKFNPQEDFVLKEKIKKNK